LPSRPTAFGTAASENYDGGLLRRDERDVCGRADRTCLTVVAAIGDREVYMRRRRGRRQHGQVRFDGDRAARRDTRHLDHARPRKVVVGRKSVRQRPMCERRDPSEGIGVRVATPQIRGSFRTRSGVRVSPCNCSHDTRTSKRSAKSARFAKQLARRDGRVVDGGGLENVSGSVIPRRLYFRGQTSLQHARDLARFCAIFPIFRPPLITDRVIFDCKSLI